MKWDPALVAAVIDQELADDTRQPREAFTREHIVAMKNSGCTKAQVRDYLIHIFGSRTINPGGTGKIRMVDHVMRDLDSYGEWPD